jgi:hypothetical protein
VYTCPEFAHLQTCGDDDDDTIGDDDDDVMMMMMMMMEIYVVCRLISRLHCCEFTYLATAAHLPCSTNICYIPDGDGVHTTVLPPDCLIVPCCGLPLNCPAW